MEEQDIIEWSTTPWVASVVLAKKKNETPYHYDQYKLPYDITETDAYPMSDLN